MTANVCIFGTGAIGSLIAAYLSRAAAVVSIVARGAQLQAIRQNGITIQAPDGSSTRFHPKQATDDASEIGVQDIVFVTVKSTALDGIAAQLAPLLSPTTSVVFVTNGIPWWYSDDSSASVAVGAIDPGSALRRAINPRQVIGGTIYSASTVIAPGVTRIASGSRLLVLGDVDARAPGRSIAVADLVRQGGLPCRVTDDIRAEVWSKLVLNLAVAPICLLTRQSISRSYANPRIRSAAARVVEEALAVAAAVLKHPLPQSGEGIIAKLAALDHKPSILQDLELGRPLEIDAILTRPLGLARMAQVDTPMLDLLTALAYQAAGVQPEPPPSSRGELDRPRLALLDADRTQPVLERTVGEALRVAAAAWGYRIALQEGSIASDARQWSFAALLSEAERVAWALLGRFTPGEHVAIAAANSPEWVAVEFGAALAGLVLVTVNPALTAEEFAYVLRQSRSCGIVAQRNFRDRDLLAMISDLGHSLPDLRDVIALDALWGETPPRRPLPEVTPDQIAQIQYTSGTTGVPKGAMLTHRGLVNNARFYARTFGAGECDVWINPMPMFHTAGCGLTTLGALQTGGKHVIAPTADATLLIDLHAAYLGTVMLCVPTMLIRMLDHLQARKVDVSARRVCTLGGAPVPPELVRRAQAEFGLRVSIGYGQTEASPYVTHTQADDSNPDWAATVGRPLPQTELKIVAPDGDAILPRGAVGEIVVRSYGVMRGYFENEPATRAVLGADGWLRTGDLGSIDALGYLRVQGRLKDMIIRGGENVFPREIEDVLFTHPGVANVAVIGLPDQQWGEVVAACIQPHAGSALTETELDRFCRRHLASFKVPRRWWILPHLPQTASGKVQKFLLREQVLGGHHSDYQ